MSIPYALQGIFQSLPADTQALVLRDYEIRKKPGLIGGWPTSHFLQNNLGCPTSRF